MMNDEAVAWIRSRPPVVQELMCRFPPGCTVVANRPLKIPRPGMSARVYSYTEAGQVSVVQEGIPFRGFCDPDWLTLVACQEGVGIDDVVAVINAKEATP